MIEVQVLMNLEKELKKKKYKRRALLKRLKE